MDRRDFLTFGLRGILLAATAPAIVRAESLMKIASPERFIILPNSAPILLIPGQFSVAHDYRGFDQGRNIALTAMVNWIGRDHAKRTYGKVREIQIFEDQVFDPNSGITRSRAKVQFLREVMKYSEEE